MAGYTLSLILEATRHGFSSSEEKTVDDHGQQLGEDPSAVPARAQVISSFAEYSNGEQDFDTGLTAWLQVFGSFFLYFNSWYDTSSLSALDTIPFCQISLLFPTAAKTIYR